MSLYSLPADLPVPSDDGACDHLVGARIPSVKLVSTSGAEVDVSITSTGYDRHVLYCYPMTGRPDTPLPTGWDEIPGARGCTIQATTFETHVNELRSLGAAVFGVSVQSSRYQLEVAERLHLSFPLLSDQLLRLASALNLPTFDVEGARLLRRVTLVVKGGVIEKVFYPIFPPGANASDVLSWLAANPLRD